MLKNSYVAPLRVRELKHNTLDDFDKRSVVAPLRVRELKPAPLP